MSEFTFLLNPGNSGSHFIKNWLTEKYYNPIYTGTNAPYSSHSRCGQLSVDYQPNNIIKLNYEHKVHYIMCNPYDWILSSYARKFPIESGHWRGWIVKDSNYFFSQLPSCLTLENYLKDEYDPIDYMSHATEYFEDKEKKYKFLFTKYEALNQLEVENVIREYWQVSENFNRYNVKKRKTNWKEEEIEIINLMEKKLGNTMKWYQNLPDYFILNSQETILK